MGCVVLGLQPYNALGIGAAGVDKTELASSKQCHFPLLQWFGMQTPDMHFI